MNDFSKVRSHLGVETFHNEDDMNCVHHFVKFNTKWNPERIAWERMTELRYASNLKRHG